MYCHVFFGPQCICDLCPAHVNVVCWRDATAAMNANDSNGNNYGTLRDRHWLNVGSVDKTGARQALAR